MTCTPTATPCSGLGLRLRELGGEAAPARTAFEQAATALEAVIAKGNREEVDRDFHFIMAAAGYHLAHLSARAFSLLAFVEADENFAPTERVLALVNAAELSRATSRQRARLPQPPAKAATRESLRESKPTSIKLEAARRIEQRTAMTSSSRAWTLR
jgi:hypothetical protein